MRATSLAAILEGLLAPPIKEWMTFLRPDQATSVCRSFNEPSRIRGAAGTGKTVVGPHRAAYLARSQANARVLMTTFVRTLPDALSNLLGRMAPDVAGGVEFSGVHPCARKVLDEHGIDVRVNSELDNQSFDEARKQTCRPLTTIHTNSRYWREELAHVIKGRGLTTFAETRRTTPLRPGAHPNRARRQTGAAHPPGHAERECGLGWGDVGVLCFTTWQVCDAVTLLRTAGTPVVKLTDYDGVPTDAVKVGTIKRAKGLEFKQVLLPWIAERLMSPGVTGARCDQPAHPSRRRARRGVLRGRARVRPPREWKRPRRR